MERAPERGVDGQEALGESSAGRERACGQTGSSLEIAWGEFRWEGAAQKIHSCWHGFSRTNSIRKAARPRPKTCEMVSKRWAMGYAWEKVCRRS